MSKATRKYVWPVSAMMAFALVAALAAFIALGVTPGVTSAHEPDTNVSDHCPGDVIADIVHNATADTAGQKNADGSEHSCETPGAAPTVEPTPPTPPGPTASDHATMPTDYDLQGLDNGARLDWDMPAKVAKGAEVVGYRITRDAYHMDANNPVNMYGDAVFYPDPTAGSITDYSDLGLAYETTYTYQVQAVVEYDVSHWWDALTCAQMNTLAGSSDTMGTGFCQDYADLSAAQVAVVGQAYDRYDDEWPPAMSYNRYALGEMSMKRTISTATSGGRLQALLDPPGPVEGLDATAACADTVAVVWREPGDFGTVPAVDADGVYVGPDYIGGRRAGKEEVGVPATSVTYHIQRMGASGVWADVTPDGMTYTDAAIVYGGTYMYRVRAMNLAGLYGPWTVVTEELPAMPPVPSVPLSPDADLDTNDASAVLFTWDPPLGDWRDIDDIRPSTADDQIAGQPVVSDNVSESLWYRVYRRMESPTLGPWVELTTDADPKVHEYLNGVSAAVAIDSIQTQSWVDRPEESGTYKYRVAALFDGCELSEGVVTAREVVVSLELGTPDGLSLASGALPGSVSLSWNAASNATMHWIAGIKQSDWDANDYSNVIWTRADTNSSHTVTGLTPGAEYVFTVAGGRGSGASEEWSGWASLSRVRP